jgi:hypothetical protein
MLYYVMICYVLLCYTLLIGQTLLTTKSGTVQHPIGCEVQLEKTNVEHDTVPSS